MAILTEAGNFALGQVTKFKKIGQSYESAVYRSDTLKFGVPNVGYMLTPMFDLDSQTMKIARVPNDLFFKTDVYVLSFSQEMIDFDQIAVNNELADILISLL